MPVALVDDFGDAQRLLVADYDSCSAANLINVADVVVGVEVFTATCGSLGFVVAVGGRSWKYFGLQVWAHIAGALHQSRHAQVR